YATDTPYKVRHYLVDPNKGKPAVLADTENLTGTTNDLIQPTRDKYVSQGYALGTTKGDSFIKADGSTIVDMYYKPIERTMTFDFGYEGASKTTVTDLIYKNIGAQIPIPTRPGYKFTGWSPAVPMAMPTKDTTY